MSPLDGSGARVWARVGDRVWARVWDRVRARVWARVWDRVWARVWDRVWARVWARVETLVADLPRSSTAETTPAAVSGETDSVPEDDIPY